MNPKQVIIRLSAVLHCQTHYSLLFAQSDWLLLDWFKLYLSREKFILILFWLGEDIILFRVKSPSEVISRWSESSCKSVLSSSSPASSGSWCKSASNVTWVHQCATNQRPKSTATEWGFTWKNVDPPHSDPVLVTCFLFVFCHYSG